VAIAIARPAWACLLAQLSRGRHLHLGAQLSKHHELLARRRDTAPGPFLPVVYVTVPPAATPKVLAAEFARFLGLPISRHLNQVNITNAVCDLLFQLRTDLVLVDEIHNLNLATRGGAESSDQLKYLAERIPATFIYAGKQDGQTPAGRGHARRTSTIRAPWRPQWTNTTGASGKKKRR
jgi:hypothetical protein